MENLKPVVLPRGRLL
ncbi:hypothetical protein CbuG_0009 [Coxiella burnetii CbuG_Q212]|nr:hypothetical protein CbuG_0009 [Coxiella burnetii CbuG_Q212]